MFTEAQFTTNSQDKESNQVPINRWMNKEDVVHIHNGILFSHKKDALLPFAAIWMDLGIIIPSKQKEKGKCYESLFSWIWNKHVVIKGKGQIRGMELTNYYT